jgi:cytochrome c-type biogenesis protein CcmF
MTGIATTCLWVAVVAATATALAATSRPVARAGAVVSALALVIPTVALGRALWTLDLSLTYVADHARGGTSSPYRLAGLWGGASGSLLLFTAMVAVVVPLLVWTQPTATRVSAARFGSLTVAALTAAVLATANPFHRLSIPAIDGGGLQPILEHPAMLYHPPLLYAGQISTIVPFLIVVGAGRDSPWRRTLRPWLGLSLMLLTVGLATGANWAYVELGWGGFWGWDPVENGVLVPWLITVAALHALGQPGYDRAVAALCAAPWVLVLVGASLTRAGIGGSVHAFADDRRVGWILLGLIVATVGVAAYGLGVRSNDRPRRFGLRVVSASLAAVAALIVLAGILYPIPAPGQPIILGPYYATLLAPLAIIALAAAAFVVGRRSIGYSVVAATATVFVAVLVGARSPFAVGVAAGVGVIVAGLIDGVRAAPRRGWSTRLGHVGFAVLLIGVAGSTQADRATMGLEVGQEIEVGGQVFRHVGVEVVAGPDADSTAVEATLQQRNGDEIVATFHPALVAFQARSVLLAETDLRSRPMSDTQVVLRNAVDSGEALYSISVTPLVMWVWWGSALIAAAGIVVVLDATRRAGFGPRDQGRSRRRFSRVRSSNAEIV